MLNTNIELNKIYCENCLDTMNRMPDNFLDSIVTDGPYGIAFMGKHWDYDIPSVEIWRECLRVLKPGGYLLAFAGTRTQHRMAVRIEDAGFEIRDMIAWVYGSGFPKSLNIGKAVDKLQGNERERIETNETIPDIRANNYSNSNGKERLTANITKGTSEWEGWGTALKPALEPITVARKPLSEKTVAENCLKWGTGGINIDACRVETDDNLNGGAYSSGEAEHMWSKNSGGGGLKRQEGKYIQPTGRFPANLIHDGSEEVLRLFPQTGQPCGSIKKTTHKDGMFGIGQPGQIYTQQDGNNRSAARFFYVAKASKAERNAGCEGLEEKPRGSNAKGYTQDVARGLDRNRPVANNHPTVKPIKLIKYLIQLVTKPGGLTYDPFGGSGTLKLAAQEANVNYIISELEPEYCKIAQARKSLNKPKQPTLF